MPWIGVVVTVVLLAGCDGAETPGTQPPASPTVPDSSAELEPAAASLPVDRAASEAWPEIAEWGIRDSLDVDLDADGRPERILLAAAAEVDDRGRAMWDDGQRWAVAVVTADSVPTLLFERFVQLGRVDVTVLDAEGGPRLLITETGGAGEMVWEMVWRGSNDAQVVGHLGGAVRSPEGRISLPE